MPRISLVTPTFQQAGTIRETIESVLGQDHADLEYWVLDAGSKDGTTEILRGYQNDPRFHWLSEPDQGQGDAINKGLARCSGDLFNWINSDDYLERGALRRVAEAFAQNPSAEIISGRTAEFRGQPPVRFNEVALEVRSCAEKSITVGVFCQPSTFWRTEIFRGLGGVDPALHYVLDWDLWVRYLARHGQRNIVCLDEVLAFFRHHSEAKTSTGSAKFYEEARIVFQNLHLTLQAPEPFLSPEVESAAGWHRRDFAIGPAFDRELYLGYFAERMVRTHRRRKPSLARTWLRRAWSYKPWISFWRIKMALRLMFR